MSSQENVLLLAYISDFKRIDDLWTLGIWTSTSSCSRISKAKPNLQYALQFTIQITQPKGASILLAFFFVLCGRI